MTKTLRKYFLWPLGMQSRCTHCGKKITYQLLQDCENEAGWLHDTSGLMTCDIVLYAKPEEE